MSTSLLPADRFVITYFLKKSNNCNATITKSILIGVNLKLHWFTQLCGTFSGLKKVRTKTCSTAVRNANIGNNSFCF